MIDVRERITKGYTGRYLLNPTRVIGIAIHHSVSGGLFYDEVPDTQDAEISHLQAIDAYHVSLGYGGFGYHLAVFPSGRWYYCGSITSARAHVASRNNELIGIVLIGDFTDNPPLGLALAGAREAIAFVRQAYPGCPIAGHKNWALPAYPTACPGDTWPKWESAPTFIPPQEGSHMEPGHLIRKYEDAEVFLRVGDLLVHIPNPEEFASLGFRWEDIENISPSDATLALPTVFPNGEP